MVAGKEGGVGMLRGPLLALWDEQTSRREGRGRKKEEGVYILEYEKEGQRVVCVEAELEEEGCRSQPPPPRPPKV